MESKVIEKYGDKTLYSFDIFDTTITRFTSTNIGIFSYMQALLQKDDLYSKIPNTLKYNFSTIRHYFEEYTYKHRNREFQEITLAQIYDNIALFYGLNDALKKLLIELEIDIEFVCSVGIDDTIADIKELLNLGKKVIFISDMYLPAEIVKQMLRKSDVDIAELPIYMSSEYLKTKSKGDLYKTVHDLTGIDYSEWVHVGDNKHSDCDEPRKLGISTKHVVHYIDTPFERFILKKNPACLQSEIALGSARLGRAGNENGNYNVGCNYGAPVLVAFIEWLLEQSVVRKINDLYFIARDGYVLRLIADKLIEARKLSIRTHYIYGSRKAWNINEKDNNEQCLLLKKYIEQELGLAKSNNFAFVDLFGSGKSIVSMQKIVNNRALDKLKVFYFKLGDLETNTLEKYGFSLGMDVWDNIEIFCKAPEGQCVGYAREGEIIKPVCEVNAGNEIVEFGFQNYIDGITAFLKYYVLSTEKHNESRLNNLGIVEWYLRYINEFPDASLRNYLTGFPRDGAEKSKIKYTKYGIIERRCELKVKQAKYLIKVLEQSRIFNLIKRSTK